MKKQTDTSRSEAPTGKRTKSPKPTRRRGPGRPPALGEPMTNRLSLVIDDETKDRIEEIRTSFRRSTVFGKNPPSVAEIVRTSLSVGLSVVAGNFERMEQEEEFAREFQEQGQSLLHLIRTRDFKFSTGQAMTLEDVLSAAATLHGIAESFQEAMTRQITRLEPYLEADEDQS